MHNCIVLGCGRSGTSVAAGELITANPDYYSGGDFIPPRTSNPDGTFEPVSIRSINEAILAQVVPKRPPPETDEHYRQIPTQWQRWLARITLDTPITSTPSIDKMIKEQVKKQPYCLKDPRFSYTFGAWLPHLKNCVFVCMFRHPAETAKSILRFAEEFEPMRSLDISYEQALEVWSLLNERILEQHYPAGGKWLFLHFNQLFTDEGMDKLAELTGTKPGRTLINKKRVRTQFRQEVPARIKSTYERLCELADYRIE